MEGTVTVLRFRPGRSWPAELRVVRRLHADRQIDPVPVFHLAAVVAGAAGGALSRRLGAPAWTPFAAALGAAGTAWAGFLGSALEPGARWRTVHEAWLDEREGWRGPGVDRSTARRIRSADFPLVGVAGWEGTRAVAGYGRADGLRISHVRLEHGDPDSGPLVTVETSRDPFLTHLEARAGREGPALQGAVDLRVDGRPVRLRRYAPGPRDRWDWAAAGQVDDVGITVEIRGLDAAALALSSNVDPGPYLARDR